MPKIIIFDFNRTLYNPDTQRLVAQTREILTDLKRCGYVLCLISRIENKRKELIAACGIRHFFTEIIMTADKSREDFKDIAQRTRANIAERYVVGDQIKKEILFGNQCGFKTIWVEQGKFKNILPSQPLEEPTYRVKNLPEIMPILIHTSV